jgi:transcriptional regulator with XRE-family HTH domain
LKSINSPMYRALGQVIREAREKLGLTQRAVAGKLEWPQNRVSNVERGQRRVEVSELEEIGWAIGVDSADLYRSARERVAPALAAQTHRIKGRPRKLKKSRQS